MLGGKYKLKQQLGIATHLLKWPISRILTQPSAGLDVEQGILFVAGGNAIWKTVCHVFTKPNINIYSYHIIQH